MPEMLRCKVCGCISDAHRAKDACPACGSPRKTLESWKDPVGEKRRFFLRLEVHSLVNHFTVAFAASGFVFSLSALLLPELFLDAVAALLGVFVGILPFTVLASFVSGLADGKSRFGKTSTPLLSRKKVIGSIFFASAVAAAALLFLVGLLEPWTRAILALVLATALVCAAGLTRIGATIRGAIVPG